MAPPAIPEGDRHRALRLFLPDDVLVQLFNNLRAPRRSMIARALRGHRRRALAARTSRGFSATPAPDVVISSSTEGTSTSRGSPPSLAEPTGLEKSRGADCEAHGRPAWRPPYHVRRRSARLLISPSAFGHFARDGRAGACEHQPHSRLPQLARFRWCVCRAVLRATTARGAPESCVRCAAGRSRRVLDGGARVHPRAGGTRADDGGSRSEKKPAPLDNPRGTPCAA